MTVRQCDAIGNERCQQREREERGRGIGEVKVKKKTSREQTAHTHTGFCREKVQGTMATQVSQEGCRGGKAYAITIIEIALQYTH